MDGERSSNQQGNAIRHSDGDVPSGQVSSMQDANEDAGPAEKQSARNEVDLDLDLPRYPTINAAPLARESGDLGGDSAGQHAGSASQFEGANEHAGSANVPKGYEGYQYMTINQMATSLHLPSAYASRSPIEGMNNMPSAQHGVWMPLQQATNAPYNSGINATGSPIYAAHSMSKSPGESCATPQRRALLTASSALPVSSGYDSTPIMANAGLSLGPMPSMGATSGSMYSHPSGPLDSPTVPYIRPSGYTSQPSQLGGMSGMYGQAGAYANNNREMYGAAPQYGHRGNMGQSMLAGGNPEYGGRFNNSMTMNRPFGGFNGGSTGPLGGSRYNPSMNGFAQSNLQGSQQQRIGLSGQGKVGPNAGRKVW